MRTYNNSTWKGHSFKWIIKIIFLLNKILSLYPFLTKMWMTAGRHKICMISRKDAYFINYSWKKIIKDDEFKNKAKFIFCTRNRYLMMYFPSMFHFWDSFSQDGNILHFFLRGMFTKLLLFTMGSKDLEKKSENGYTHGTVLRILSSITSFIEDINYFICFSCPLWISSNYHL